MSALAPAVSKVRPHGFEQDPTVPADYYGRVWCRWCRLPGTPGDDRHPPGAAPVLPPTPAAALEVDRRRLGEHDQEGDRG